MNSKNLLSSALKLTLRLSAPCLFLVGSATFAQSNKQLTDAMESYAQVYLGYLDQLGSIGSGGGGDSESKIRELETLIFRLNQDLRETQDLISRTSPEIDNGRSSQINESNQSLSLRAELVELALNTVEKARKIARINSRSLGGGRADSPVQENRLNTQFRDDFETEGELVSQRSPLNRLADLLDGMKINLDGIREIRNQERENLERAQRKRDRSPLVSEKKQIQRKLRDSEQIRDAHASDFQNQKRKKQQLESELKNLDQRVASLKQEISSNKSNIDRITRVVPELDQKIANLQQKSQKWESEAGARKKAIETEHQAKQHEIIKTRGELRRWQEKPRGDSEVIDMIESLRKKIQQLQLELRQIEKRHGQIGNNPHTQEISKLQKSRSNKIRRKAELIEENQKIPQRIKNVQAKKQTLPGEIQNLQRQISQTRSKLDDAEKVVQRHSTQLQKINRELAPLRDRILRAKENLDKSQQRVNRARELFQSSQGALETMRSLIRELNHVLENSRGSGVSPNPEYQRLIRIERDLINQVSRAEAQIRELREGDKGSSIEETLLSVKEWEKYIQGLVR